MKFVGSKNRISKYIVPFIQNAIDKNNINTYIEPFVGGANIIDKIQCEHRIGIDTHKELIALFKALQNGWEPPLHISEEEYIRIRDNKENYPDCYVGLVGFCSTWGSKWFGGYARGYKNDGISLRDMPNEAIRNLLSQLPKIKDVDFICDNYLNLEYPKPAVIYCDPPYANKNKYYHIDFDSNAFWNWCREQSKKNILFISEYQAPSDFKCIWSKNVKTSLSMNNDVSRVEKLFIPCSQSIDNVE